MTLTIQARQFYFCVALLALLLAMFAMAQAQTTAFNYQGKLDDGGNPANGAYDFEFRLFDALSVGTQIGSTVTVNNLNVAAGIFTTTLDFGAAAFPGANRWLEISVRPGASTGAYTTLSPRQRINSTPYAIKSLNATAADSLSSACAGCVHSTQIESISSTQLNDLIHGSALELPLLFNGSSSFPIVSASNGGGGTGVFGGSTTTSGVGVYGQNTNAGGTAIYGTATSGAGPGVGVQGISGSTDGKGVWGRATNTTGFTYGVFGEAASPDGVGVAGLAPHTTGLNVGTFGRTDSSTGSGVYGLAWNTTGANIGVEGQSRSSSGIAISGRASSTTGTNYGVFGSSSGNSGRGVYGVATSAAASAVTYGVYGLSQSLDGTNASGVYGESRSSVGNGLYGVASNTSPAASGWGVYGKSQSEAGRGVYGVAEHATGINYGVYGATNSPNGYAGYFQGRVNVTGLLSKGGGSFKIDHPLDPENKYLYHSFVESPEMMNIYNGNVTTNAEGLAVVTLPEWFEALNRDFRYQLTVIGTFAQAIVAEEISDNSFKIKTSAPQVKVSWQVTGVRQDAFANKHRIKVEEDKPAAERGTYLHPDAFNQPEEKGVNWTRNPGLMRELKESRERSLRGEPEPKPTLLPARRDNQ